jgi:hypothetical protein
MSSVLRLDDLTTTKKSCHNPVLFSNRIRILYSNSIIAYLNSIIADFLTAISTKKVLTLAELRSAKICRPGRLIGRHFGRHNCRMPTSFSRAGIVCLVHWLCWHFDGNNKLIRWRFVVHGSVDGYTRIPVFLHCPTNSGASTVLQSFLSAVQEWGLQSRVRCDRGRRKC